MSKYWLETVTPVQQAEAQKKWEMHCTEEAIKRYYESMTKVVKHPGGGTSRVEAKLADTEIGQRIMRDMIGTKQKGLYAAILRKQEEIDDILANSGRLRKPAWYYAFGAMDALKLAVITTRTILTTQRLNGSMQPPALNLSSSIALAIRDEVDFEDWREVSKANAKQYENKRDLHALLVGKCRGNVNRKMFANWKAKISDIRTTKWSSDFRIQLGSVLLHLAVEHGGGWVALQDVPHKGRGSYRRCVVLSEDALRAINVINQELEINTPYRLPMIAEPMPWTLEE